MRVLSTVTNVESGKICFEGKPLTGTVYKLGLDAETIVAEYSVLTGDVVATDLRWGTIPRTVVREPMDMPEHTGSSFSGVSFSFSEDGRLVDEFTYLDGVSGPFSIFYSSGAIAKYAENVDSTDEWSENGVLKSVTRDGFYASYDDAGNLVTFELEEQFLAELLHRLPLSVGSKLSLTGQGITDAVLTLLIGGSQLRTLNLEDTRISVLGLRALCRDNLMRLTTLGNELLSLKAIQSVVDSLPNCVWHHAEPISDDDADET